MLLQYIVLTLLCMPLSVESQEAEPIVTCSQVVKFPVNGNVLVESLQEENEYPTILLSSEKTGKILLQHAIRDHDGLIKEYRIVEFKTFQPDGFESPIILGIGIIPGGSDSSYYGVLIGEVNGKLEVLNKSRLYIKTQGGFYLGYLNKKYGPGFVSWTFIWGDNPAEAHYDLHHYKIEVFAYRNGRFIKVKNYISRKRYENYGVDAPGELGIQVTDLRSQFKYYQD